MLLADYKQPIASVWKPFGAAGKDRIPVADLLKCRSGLEGAMPAKLSTFSCFNTEELDELAGQIVGNPADVLGEGGVSRLCATLSLSFPS